MRFVLSMLSFGGRSGRLAYWSVGIVQMALVTAGAVFFAGSVGVFRTVGGRAPAPTVSATALIVLLVVVLLAAWIGLAATVRRWHDRGKSGWWCLVGGIPIVGPLWVLVELGFLGPVDGNNRYGPRPDRGGGSDRSTPDDGIDADRVVAEWRARTERDRAATAAAVRSAAGSVVSRPTPSGFGRRGLAR